MYNQKKIFGIMFFVMFAILVSVTVHAQEAYDEHSLLVEYQTTSSVGLFSAEKKGLITDLGRMEFLYEQTNAAEAEGVRLQSAETDSAWYLLRLNDGVNVEDARKQLRELPGVTDVNYNYYVTLFDMNEPVRQAYAPEVQPWSINQCGVAEARTYLEKNGWNGGGRRDVVVAVIDSGIDYVIDKAGNYLFHPDLADNVWTNIDEIPNNGIDDDGNGYIDDVYGWNFGDEDNDISDVASNSHGTHCAGVVAAAQNGFGTCGVAYNAQVMPIRVMGWNDSEQAYVIELSSLIKGIEYACKNGADVVSMSMGVGASASLAGELKTEITSLRKVIGKYPNVIFVAAAGNQSTWGENQSQVRHGYPNEGIAGVYSGGCIVTYPAAFTSVVGVMSSDETPDANGDWLSTFSRWDSIPNNNIEYEIMAPGKDIYSTIKNGSYGYLSGTSMSAPYVSGCYALLLTKYKGRRDFNTNSVKKQLLNNCVSVQGLTTEKGVFSFPLVDIEKALKARKEIMLKVDTQVIEKTDEMPVLQTSIGAEGNIQEQPDFTYQYEKQMKHRQEDGTCVYEYQSVEKPTNVGTYRVTVTADNLYYYGKTSSLIRVAPPAGDFDGDGVITKDDIRKFHEYKRKYASNRTYTPEADVNHDGKIDAKDLSMLYWYLDNSDLQTNESGKE